ncbi:aspartyl protease family protein At5g10770 [Ananas comosus]|uniref:Aspartyl protease family protein At5g10770 n=1 Tax=Ananas comosus TaxID=4615 RepID=A0A6P5G4Z7_ANACO|nr:aspartyl protease family protein At5g10770 [Ananas comosus]
MLGVTTTVAAYHLLLVLVLLLLLLLLLFVDGGRCRTAEVEEEERRVVALRQLEWGESSAPRISSPLISREHSGATVLQLKHSSRLCRENKDYEHHLRYLLISDEERVSWLQSRIKRSIPNNFQKDSSETQIPLNSGIRLQTLNYVTAVGIGGKATTVIVDTGSDLTWVQCKPCVSCYTQQDPLFDPSLSPSYRSVPCNATACSSSLQAATGTSGICGNDRTSCYYLVSYGDGSYTRGVLAQERISLGETNVENFIFGCGRSNRGLFGGTSGLMGLGRTELSLVSQTTNQFGGVFSYCLPSRPYNSSGSLVLGSDLSVYKNSTPISYTRMISDPEQQPFYFLNLTGLRVGAVELQAPGFSNGKVLIDSGTVITRLAPSVYKALKDEFVRQFAAYPTAPGFSILDTCFNLSGYEEVKVPTLRLGFEGDVQLNVDVTGIFYFVKRDASQVCLAFASLSYEDQAGIIGNYQQKNQRVVYDTIGSKLGFAQEECSYS